MGIICKLKDSIGNVIHVKAATGELLRSEKNKGVTFNLNETNTSVVFFSEFKIIMGSIVQRTRSLPIIKLGSIFFNNIIDVFGKIKNKITSGLVLDILNYLKFKGFKMNFDRKAPAILNRQSIYEYLETGIKIADCLIPIGLGQRELILGDRKTGKSTICFDIILNQKSINPFLSNFNKN